MTARRLSAHLALVFALRLPAWARASAPSARQRVILGIGGGRPRLEHRARFPRIGIDGEIDHVGRKPAEIDAAVLDRLRRRRHSRSRRRNLGLGEFAESARPARRSGRPPRRSRSPAAPASPRRSARRSPARGPSTCTRPPLRGDRSNDACADEISRTPAASAIAARVASSASISRCRPLSGICATGTKTRQGPRLCAAACTAISACRVALHLTRPRSAASGNVQDVPSRVTSVSLASEAIAACA